MLSFEVFFLKKSVIWKAEYVTSNQLLNQTETYMEMKNV